MKALSKPGNKNSGSSKSGILSRITVILCGLVLVVGGCLRSPGKVLGLTDRHYRQTVFPAGIAATGFLIMVLALIPDKGVERLTRTIRRKNKMNRH